MTKTARRPRKKRIHIREFGRQCRLEYDELEPVEKLRSYLELRPCGCDSFAVRLQLVRDRDERCRYAKLDDCLPENWQPPDFTLHPNALRNEVRDGRTSWSNLGLDLAEELLNRSVKVTIELDDRTAYVEVSAPGFNSSGAVSLRHLHGFVHPQQQ